MAFDLFAARRALFTFHDRDIAPEGATPRESNLNVRRVGRGVARKMETPASACCGARPTSSANRRYAAGAATNPNPRCSPTPPRR